MPTILGLTLCEDVVIDLATGNLSLIRAFSGMGVDGFPTIARPFRAFAAFTDGFGDAEAELSVGLLGDGFELIHRVRSKLVFADRLQIVYYVMKLLRCPLPRAGVYLVTLQLDGEWFAQRSLRVYSSGSTP
jgi:hypothetical protein